MRNLVYKWWMRLTLQNCIHREGDLANSCAARNGDYSTAVVENPVLCFALSMCYKLATWRVRCPVIFQNTNYYPELWLWNFSASFPGVPSYGCIVCYTAVLSVVTQRSSEYFVYEISEEMFYPNL